MKDSVQRVLGPGRGTTRIGELAWIVILGGTLVPAVSALSEASSSDFPDHPIRVELDGRHSWWEVRYAAPGAVLANELRVPVGRPVELVVTSREAGARLQVAHLGVDVVASADAPTRLHFVARDAGVFPVAGGAFAVIAEEPHAFEEWLTRQTAPSVMPTDPALLDGRDTFFRRGCHGCHAIRGTAAHGRRGPDLTHVGSRYSLAAASLDAHLRGSGARPARTLAAQQERELRALATYLASLK